MSKATPWSTSEVEATVLTYRQMLVAELSGQSYNKRVLNQELMARLDGRSAGAIEFKHANISAVPIAPMSMATSRAATISKA